MVAILVPILILVIINLVYAPRIDRTETGEILLWYNKDGGRHYITLKK